MRLRLGISTCPNDTFVFHAILNGKVDLRGLDLDIVLLDVQELNEALSANHLDVSKASFHAAFHLATTHGVLRVGSAMGRGVGPIVVAPSSHRLTAASTVLCPGDLTSAALLLRCLHPEVTAIEHHLFSELVGRLIAGEGDFAVLIHEGRFTYDQVGLVLVEDLGETWERRCGGPLPLGGIVARRDLGQDVHRTLSAVIPDSLAYAQSNRRETLETISQYAQELDERVIWPYVDLYVNEHTHDFGHEGENALRKLGSLARIAGVTPSGVPSLPVLE